MLKEFKIMIDERDFPKLETYARKLKTRAKFGIDAREFLKEKGIDLSEMGLSVSESEELETAVGNWQEEPFMMEVYRQAYIDETVGYVEPSEELSRFIQSELVFPYFKKLKSAKSNKEINEAMSKILEIYNGGQYDK